LIPLIPISHPDILARAATSSFFPAFFMIEAQSKICFLIIGLPRSGTSTVSQFLDHLGVYFGDPSHFLDTKKFPHNPIFYELQWVNDFNYLVIKTLNRPDAGVEEFLPVESDFQRPEMMALRQSLQKQFRQEFGDRPIVGVKDPRMCFTLPLWQSVLAEMGYTVKTVLTLRSSSAILKSNLNLTPVTLSRWQRCHARHLMAIRYFTRDVPLCHFDYDLLMRRPQEYGKEKAAELGLAIPDPAGATRHLSSKHYHHQADEAGSGDAWVDRIDADLRAGRLDPGEYLNYRSAALLFMDEMTDLQQRERLRQERDAAGPQLTAVSDDQGLGEPSREQWFQEHQQLRSLLQKGGRFDVKPKADGTIDIRRLSK
jgi:hypothetical protein